MTRASCGLAVFAAAGLLTTLAAQAREPAFVQVVDAKGTAMAGATITCFASPGVIELVVDTDVVEVVADARGRALRSLTVTQGC